MNRDYFLHYIEQAFRVHPVVALLGPRQCGKTTLAKQYCKTLPVFPKQNHFDLEDDFDLTRLSDPKLVLSELKDLVVIDEIQKAPDLFKTLRVLVDEKKRSQRYLILGSASRDLIQQSSETLAGRIEYIELTPFSLFEGLELKKYWRRGGFPNSYLAKNDSESAQWRKAYIRTYLERDIPNLGFKIPAQTLRRFWLMLTHYHGNIFNASEIGRSLGVASTTIRNYLDILTGTFMVRELLPWHENIAKRQVKSPKIYFRDCGIYHALLDINNEESLMLHPKLGASWEGMALEQIIAFHHADSEECFFWSIHSQAELDLLLFLNGKRIGFEFKYSDKPALTKSMQTAMELLKLDRLFVISPGDHDFPLTNNIRAVGLQNYIRG